MIKKKSALLFFIILILFITLSIASYSIRPNAGLQELLINYGYVGFFIVSFISGFNLIFPLFHIIFIPLLLNAGLNTLVLIMVAALGTTMADGLSYWLGWAGNSAFSDITKRFRFYVERAYKRSPLGAPVILLLWAAFMPLPNELLIIPLGIARYGALKILLITLLGNTVFNSIIIFTGSTLL